jgi:hypothetical protein
VVKNAVLGIFLGSVVIWALAGTFVPRQAALIGADRRNLTDRATRHRLAELQEKPMEQETIGSVAQGESVSQKLLCGCIATRQLLYCAICEQCIDHCDCSDEERSTAYHKHPSGECRCAERIVCLRCGRCLEHCECAKELRHRVIE